MRILVADDEQISRRVLSAMLQRLGHEALTVENGLQAWEQLERPDAPRVAILDWNMPGLDGLELCRRLRGARAQYTYVILITARNGSGDLVTGLEAGADDFIAKPVEAGELRARVRVAERLLELQTDNERSRIYLSGVLSQIESAVLLADAAGKVVFANNAFSRISGTPVEAMVGQAREELVKQYLDRVDLTSVVQLPQAEPPVAGQQRFTIDVVRPNRRVFRGTTTPIELPEGTGRLEIYDDITSDVERERFQTRLARTDPLTGLLNRRGVEEALGRELARRKRAEGPLSVALFDIDHFKRVNDTYGHATGDEVIRLVGRALAEGARATDYCARWGGEELLLVLPGTDREGGLALADRVRQRVANTESPGLPRVTVSAGVGEVLPNEADPSAALTRADAQLYKAKESGRNAVR